MSKAAKNMPVEAVPPKTEESQQSPAVSLPETQTTTALALVTQSITELNKVALEVAALEPKYKGVVFDVKTTAGMKAACEARLAIRRPRYTIQKMQKDAKTPLNALKKGIDDQVDAVIARITAIEDPIHEQIANEETRKQREKEAKEAAERARVTALQARVDELRQLPLEATGMDSQGIESLIKRVVELDVDDSFQELKQQAEGAKATTLIRLRAAHTKALGFEAEQKRLAEERAENERIRLENEARAEAERKRIAEEQRIAQQELAAERARIAEAERIAREAQEAEAARQAEALRRERAENDRIEQERQEAREAEDRRIAAERAEADRVEAERRSAADAETQRLATERAELERQRQELDRIREAGSGAPAGATASESSDSKMLDEGDTDPDAGTSGPEATSLQGDLEPMLTTIALTEFLAMQTVCNAAKEWAEFQRPEIKRACGGDKQLATEARKAAVNLLAAVEMLP